MFISLIKNKNNFNLAVIFLAILPVMSLIGSSYLNLSIVIIDIFFLYEMYKKKKFIFFKNKFFFGLIFFWLILLINLIFFSIDFENSLSRSLGFLRFILLIFAIKFYVFSSENYRNFILNSWLIIFCIISIDVLIEFSFGRNILGFKSSIPGRLVSFLDQEYKIGYIYSFLGLTSFIHIFSNYKKLSINLKTIYFIIFLILLISFLIGERSNFLKTFIIFSIIIFIIERRFFRYKYLLTSLFILTLSIFIMFAESSEKIGTFQQDKSYKYRFWTTFLKPLIENPINSLKNTNYGDHYKTAYLIFKDYKIAGVGLKNYRIIIYDENNKYNFNPSTHPHEKHLEILSELGLIGYFSLMALFLYSIYNGIKYRFNNLNSLQLAGSLFFIANIIPLIPSGSLFTTYSATYFWISFAFLISVYEK